LGDQILTVLSKTIYSEFRFFITSLDGREIKEPRKGTPMTSAMVEVTGFTKTKKKPTTKFDLLCDEARAFVREKQAGCFTDICEHLGIHEPTKSVSTKHCYGVMEVLRSPGPVMVVADPRYDNWVDRELFERAQKAKLTLGNPTPQSLSRKLKVNLKISKRVFALMSEQSESAAN